MAIQHRGLLCKGWRGFSSEVNSDAPEVENLSRNFMCRSENSKIMRDSEIICKNRFWRRTEEGV
eukprot:1160534-Pelagomonas_calceolata.AAC.16